MSNHQEQPPDPNDLASIIQPLFTTFSVPQIESLLYAYVPNTLPQKYKTGIYAVDTFVVTASCTLLLVFLKLVIKALNQIINFKRISKKVEILEQISVVIEPTHYDDYHSTPNIYHQALSHLISENAQDKSSGYYKLKPDMEIDHEAGKPPAFNMVPEPDQVHTIEFDGNSFQVTFETSTNKSGNNQPSSLNTPKSDTLGSILPGSKYSKPGIRSSTATEPHIRVSIISSNQADITVSTISHFLESITKDYMTYITSLKKKNRSRYDYSVSGKWVRICSLYEVQGLDTVALCPMNEELIKEDLNSFRNNKLFYKRVGFPYRRGLLFQGPPGTGKTSLVFAIASELHRDLYFMNLSYIDSDSELFQAFANVPANSIVVFEDVDTMSASLHRRSNTSQPPPQDTTPHHEIERQDKNTHTAIARKFNLTTFLSVLDGHTLEDGIIFIMTTNHQERLDPAIIRPGRMDIHLDLRYATLYQMRRIYKMVMDQDDPSTLDDIYPNLGKEIQEFVIPPSEIMQVMVLCRNKKNRIEIPRKLKQLNEKYCNKM